MDTYKCLYCSKPVPYDYLVKNICPFFTSMGPSGGTFDCPSCGEHLTTQVYRRDDELILTPVQIIGMGDYISYDPVRISPAPRDLGWFIHGYPEDLWKKKGWSQYLLNHLDGSVGEICVAAGKIADLAKHGNSKELQQSLKSEEFTIYCLEGSYFDDPLENPLPEITLTTGEKYQAEFSAGALAELESAARKLHRVGWAAYHGQTFNEAWMKYTYPSLLVALNDFAKFLPRTFTDRAEYAQRRSEELPHENAIVLGGSVFRSGVNFIEPEQQERFRTRRRKEHEGGGFDLLEKYFEDEKTFELPFLKWRQFRIFVHVGGCWSTWKKFGPFYKHEVDPAIEQIKKDFPAQKCLAPGVYEARGTRMNKIEIYKERELVREINFVHGRKAR